MPGTCSRRLAEGREAEPASRGGSITAVAECNWTADLHAALRIEAYHTHHCSLQAAFAPGQQDWQVSCGRHRRLVGQVEASAAIRFMVAQSESSSCQKNRTLRDTQCFELLR